MVICEETDIESFREEAAQATELKIPIISGHFEILFVSDLSQRVHT